MPYKTLIEPVALLAHLNMDDWAIVDCRFSLDDTERGRRDYGASHIPGALYLHLDEDLSGPIVADKTGRHPLPTPERAAAVFSRLGIDRNVQVVAYDDAGGSVAARVWWMLKWLGHDHVAVLDGGWQAWNATCLPTTDAPGSRTPRTFIPQIKPGLVADVHDVEAAVADPSLLLLDARAPERYLGIHEPIDPVAGHIPGASNLPWDGNLDSAGRFLPPDQLKLRLEDALRGTPGDQVICYCGSGVSALHIALAMAHTDLPLPRLYAGSWSEWITDPLRPVATGPEE